MVICRRMVDIATPAIRTRGRVHARVTVAGMLLALAALGCTGTPPQDRQDPLTLAPAKWSGRFADEGYGSRIARNGATVAVGAPFGGRVYFGETVVISEPEASFVGAGLTAFGHGFLVGAPGTGRVVMLDNSGRMTPISGDLLGSGGVIAAQGATWTASAAHGLRLSDGSTKPLEERPDSIAFLSDGTLVIGCARGTVAAWIGAVAVGRVSVEDEAGYAVIVGDVDGDGQDDVVVGAPGMGEVRIYDTYGALQATIQGEGGRFGAAVALGESGELWVGAPMFGANVRGAVYRVRDLGPAERIYEGEAGDQLGTAVVTGHGNVIAGAPGLAEEAGSVWIERP